MPVRSRVSPDDLLASFADVVLHVDQNILEYPVLVDVNVRHVVQ